MYKVIIVDDEPLFTDGLAECLREVQQPAWEVYRAYNGYDALSQLEQLPVDVALLDIRMPGMDGLQLQREIQGKWPKCKVIFLTGHDEFGYIQEALRQGSCEYILKMEGDEVIAAALHKVAEMLDEEMLQEQWITNARARLQLAESSLQKTFVQELMDGELVTTEGSIHNSDEIIAHMEQMNIPLKLGEPLLLVLGKVDEWPKEMNAVDRALLLYAIQNIAQELLESTTLLLAVEMDQSHILWLMQKKTKTADSLRTIKFVEGVIGQIQEKVALFLKLHISFVISNRFIGWSEVHMQYYGIKNRLFRHFGLQQQLFLLEEERQDNAVEEGQELNVQHQINQVRFAIEYNQQEKFRMLLTELSSANPYVQSHIYFSLAAIAYETIQKWELAEITDSNVDMSMLFAAPPLDNWDKFLTSYGQLMALLFAKRFKQWEQEGMDVLTQIQAFLSQELHADLSLNRIAEQFSYHPVYLSRLYKRLSGHSLSEDIAAMRLERAQRMLADKQLKINEVGKAVGFESPRYFTKFFKTHTGMTPQEFRDQ